MGEFLRKLWEKIRRVASRFWKAIRPWWFTIVVVLVLNGMPLMTDVIGQGPKTQPIAELFTDAKAHQAKGVELSADDHTATVTLQNNKKYVVVYTPDYGAHITDFLQQNNVPVTVKGKSFWEKNGWLIIFTLFLIVILVVVAFVLPKRLDMRNKGAKMLVPSQMPKERFSDVGGADEIVTEIMQTVDALKNPERYRNFGVNAPTGYLLFGGPGTGKTLLARAIAGEAGVPFFALKGSDFQGRWLNEGPAAVREAFEEARRHAPSIIFIDEIDSIASKRSSDTGSGSKELNNTANQLLHELDGFNKSEGGPQVVVIGATNRPEDLDPAVRRPGRLTRQIYMPEPDRAARRKILELHTQAPKQLASDVDFDRLVRLTSGESGAVLGNLANEAGLIALREDPKATEIAMRHFLEALDSSQIGIARKNRKVAEEDRRIAAIHEAGHALTALFTEEADDPERVTIIARGMTGGHTRMGGEDRDFLDVSHLRVDLLTSMGGRAAEKLVLGADKYTTGAEHDLEHATETAIYMVCKAVMTSEFSAQVDMRTAFDPRRTKAMAEVDRLVREAEAAAMSLLTAHRTELDALVARLLEVETLEGDELKAMFVEPAAA